ncbi:MAG TPA: molecular chaperone DnaJ, partial [Verrucomicrobiae bacterium]|jgi:Flp pilus assembly protein TadD
VELETDLRLNPKDFKAHGNLGSIFLQEGNLAAAVMHFESALRLNPGDALARAGLDAALKAAGQPKK